MREIHLWQDCNWESNKKKRFSTHCNNAIQRWSLAHSKHNPFPLGIGDSKCKIVVVLITQNTRNRNIQHLIIGFKQIKVLFCVNNDGTQHQVSISVAIGVYNVRHMIKQHIRSVSWHCSVHRRSSWTVEDMDFVHIKIRYHEASIKISSIYRGPQCCSMCIWETIYFLSLKYQGGQAVRGALSWSLCRGGGRDHWCRRIPERACTPGTPGGVRWSAPHLGSDCIGSEVGWKLVNWHSCGGPVGQPQNGVDHACPPPCPVLPLPVASLPPGLPSPHRHQ